MKVTNTNGFLILTKNLKKLLKDTKKLLQQRLAMQHDHRLDDTAGLNSDEVKGDEEFQNAVLKFKKIQEELSDIEDKYGEAMEEYLRPYIELAESPESSFNVPNDEHHRWQVAETLKAEKEKKIKIILIIICDTYAK